MYALSCNECCVVWSVVDVSQFIPVLFFFFFSPRQATVSKARLSGFFFARFLFFFFFPRSSHEIRIFQH